MNYSIYLQKSIDLKLQRKLYNKAYILYVRCVDLLTRSPTKLDFLFYDFFCDLLYYFKDSAKINKKEKDKTAFKTAYNRVREVK